MRKVNIENDLRIGFPGRDAGFHDGVEMGMLATLMALGLTEFTRSISDENIEQARVLGQHLGYHLNQVKAQGCEKPAQLTFRDRRQRPKLRVV